MRNRRQTEAHSPKGMPAPRTTKGAQKACYERATGNVARRMKFDVMPTEAVLLLRHDNPHKKREHLTAVAYRIARI